jgi:signal transduction histidine kinase
MDDATPAKLLNHLFAMSRLLAGQLDFRSAIQAVATEIAHILPHDHLDVCILRPDGQFHTAYESGIETDWGKQPHAPIVGSPIRSLLLGEALESERQRIGMDLHDQTLADLTRLTRHLERLSVSGPLLRDALDPITRGLHGCMQDLRQIIEQAKPSLLQLFGFAHAVEHHLDRAIRHSGHRIDGTLSDNSAGAFDRLDPTVSIALFRIAQAAINNAVTHAQAGRIAVLLEATPAHVSLAISDDGRGIAKRRARIGSGIDNMKTRARLISARCALTSGHGGAGTSVAITLPLASAAMAAE